MEEGFAVDGKKVMESMARSLAQAICSAAGEQFVDGIMLLRSVDAQWDTIQKMFNVAFEVCKEKAEKKVKVGA